MQEPNNLLDIISYRLLNFRVQYHGAEIQLLDMPGIIEGASEGWSPHMCDSFADVN